METSFMFYPYPSYQILQITKKILNVLCFISVRDQFKLLMIWEQVLCFTPILLFEYVENNNHMQDI